MGFFDKVFGTHSEREVKLIEKTVAQIEALRPQMLELPDAEFPARTEQLKERLAAGETLDDLLPEAYALAREAARRTMPATEVTDREDPDFVGMEPYHVQLIGAVILHQGRIAEMRTGEGKTLVATLPAYLNALEGRGVHVITVNDYLAQRDSEWMRPVYEFLGVTVGCVLSGMTKQERQKNYACDITYITNNEDGFDYLRDNMAIYERQLSQRELHYAIIDEVDSVLIDEARTPLIISGQSGKSTDLYEMCDRLALQMKKGEASGEFSKMDALMGIEIEETGDFIVNEKDKLITLTEEGMKKAEAFFHIENYSDAENLEIQHNVILALRAHYLMFRDKDYIVKDDQVLIVDEFTGRVMPGRRYSDGLHQAIEAKEHVKVKRESKTLATITFQNFFNKYDKKCGMTGTALTEENEFREIYGMDVVAVPPNKPVIRVDKEDVVYQTKKEKIAAVVREILEAHQKGQPVLVGTTTIEMSETIGGELRKYNKTQRNKEDRIEFNILNAKFHEQEAAIVAEAGRHGAVTIATNMAGRGTDIKLDPEARAAGGLKIIGTERHESRRIDNQLRGRSGRQGDPGESIFFLSLEDDVLRLFIPEKMMGVFSALGMGDGTEIHHKALSSSIEKAQQKIEGNNFGVRKNLLEYDQVMNEQREIIYDERRRVLKGESMRDAIFSMISETIDNAVDHCFTNDTDPAERDLEELNQFLTPIMPVTPLTHASSDAKSAGEIKQELKEEASRLYEAKEAEAPDPEQFREIERVVLLKVIDSKWMNHIDDMEQLRQGIGLQAYGQKDPLVEYKLAGYEMFDALLSAIQQDVLRLMFHIRIEQKVERKEVAKATGTNKDDSAKKKTVKREGAKIYPNAPCPCGSGKKYKNCCGKRA